MKYALLVHGVKKVIAADAITVAVAARADDFELVVRQLDTCGDSEGPAMQGVHTVGVDITRQVRRAADAADDTDLMRPQAQVEERSLQRGENGEVAAARTPVGVDATPVGFFG